MYLDIDCEEYLNKLEISSVDPMVELGFLLQLYNKNLRLFYFYEDSSLMEIKLPASSNDAEYITLFYFKSMFHTIKEVKNETQENKIDLAKFGRKPNKGTKKGYNDDPVDEQKLETPLQSMAHKSKTTVFSSNLDEKMNEAKLKKTSADRKANYRNKDMSLTSGAFIPQSKDNKPPSPPPGFDPLPSKSSKYMKSGYSSHVYPNQNLFAQPPMQNSMGGIKLTGMMPMGISDDSKIIGGSMPGWGMPGFQTMMSMPTGSPMPRQFMDMRMQMDQSASTDKLKKAAPAKDNTNNSDNEFETNEFKPVQSTMPKMQSAVAPSYSSIMPGLDMSKGMRPAGSKINFR